MKELWRRTTALFWQYPILWLPVLAADLLGFVLRQCVQGLSHSITSWLVQQSHGSVLGGAPDSAQLRTLTFEAIAVTAPLKLGSYFATILAYTVALAITAGLVGRALQGSTPVFRSWLVSLVPKAGPALVLAAKVLGLCLAGFTLTAIPIWSETLLSPRSFGYLIASLWLAVVAYFSVPLAIRFLHAGTIPNSRTAVAYSRIIAIAAVTCSVFLTFFCAKAESSILVL